LKYESNKTLLVNWKNQNCGDMGGQETIFSRLSKLLNGKEISYLYAANILGDDILNSPFTQSYQGRDIDRYLQLHEKLFNLKLIIKNSGIGGKLKLKTPVISLFQDPYSSIYDELYKLQHNYYEIMEHYSSMMHLQKGLAKNSELNIAVSNFMKNDMEQLGIKCDKVIDETTDFKTFRELDNVNKIKKSFKIPLNKKVGIYVGKFIPQKGWKMLSDLIKEFKDVFWIVVLTIFADIRSRYNNVEIFKQMHHSLMPSIYNCADFMVNPSWIESFSLSSLEACACNKPIVMTKTGFAWDWWDNKIGVRVDDYNDFQAYKNAINKIIEHPNKFKPREIIMEKFPENKFNNAWKKIAENYNAL